MSKDQRNIQQSIRAISHREIEVLSAIVVSVDESAFTMEVRPSLYEDADVETITVTLNAISNNGNGYILYPSINSHVVIGSVDGPGEYTLIRASDITKAVVKIGDQVLTMDGNKYGFVKGSESMKKLLDDLIIAIKAITVTTSTGPSGIPINATDFNNIKTRVDNFLNS